MFTGDSDADQGKRVLAQIMDLCNGKTITLNQVESHAYLAARTGMKEVGERIVQRLNEIPQQPKIETEFTDD